MLLPRYSIRSVMYLAVAVAGVAVVGREALAGDFWAIGLIAAIGSLAVSWTVLALFYAIVAAFARVALPAEMKRPQPAYYPEIHPPPVPSTAGDNEPHKPISGAP